jgi:hypothetical protein
MEQLEHIPLRQIDDDPRFQVRLQWDPATDASLDSLAASLAGLEGLIHPVIVVRLAQPTTFGRAYALIAGHRRLAAARRLRWPTIPARVLPPCDLTVPLHRLRLLAIAVRENTEREDLAPADRRAALRQLQALYEAVYPETAQPRRQAGQTGSAPPPVPFTRWAAKVTKIPAHTIRRDLRLALFTTPMPRADSPDAPAASHTPMEEADSIQSQVHHTCSAVQHATAALQALATVLTMEARTQLPDVQFTTLHQTLETLQTALAEVWPLVRVQTEHPLVPFALVAQEQLAALRGTLWGLRTGPPDAWATLSPTVARQVHIALATLLADWQEVAPLVQGRLSNAPAADAASPPTSHPWGQPVAVA